MSVHGTRAMYVRQKCRCEDCRAANAAYGRARYQGHAQLQRNLARTDDLEALEQSLQGRALHLQATGQDARLDEVQRLRGQIARIQQARQTATQVWPKGSVPHRLDEVEHLIRQRVDPAEAVRRLGWSSLDTAQKAAERYQRSELASTLQAAELREAA
ncbi:hypothetical protein Bra3105_06555 [Brachybacterium halotolerans subsp. kimchii]|uniref:hypothetical protein n=1 Tax=Brachybacterium halotolerans TaxID=2795215 RepID=UPI001E48AB17|nr:hypothetical protein [Brachybacterium halotolerans]UEJ83967.1 hypothetical protein Bra3105_06555 [Brachybacterium halotolerans subsp. kimchii]